MATTMTKAELEERISELEDELEAVHATAEKALKALDDDDPEEAADLLADLLDEGEEEEQANPGDED
jgi:arsenate reductase-like glutaredoxin family protein